MSRIEDKKHEIQLQAKAIRHAFTQVFGERSSKVWELDRILSQMDEQCHQLAETINRVEKISAAEKKTIQVSQTSLRVCMEDTISNYEPFISLG